MKRAGRTAALGVTVLAIALLSLVGCTGGTKEGTVHVSVRPCFGPPTAAGNGSQPDIALIVRHDGAVVTTRSLTDSEHYRTTLTLPTGTYELRAEGHRATVSVRAGHAESAHVGEVCG
ncbi:MAG: hypothetical protein ACR2FF_02545 [Mycobacteriales bacterium]|nr:MAG: hypothetical protein DLM56_10370 [Pseudonocardiales bacterium]